VAEEREPVDPYAESDEMIDAALAAGDPDAAGRPIEESRRIDRFRRTSAGTALAAGMLGLRDALEGRPEREQPAIVVDAPAPSRIEDIDVRLDFDDPGRSRVVIRRPLPEGEAPET
jgi:hypothetical protein